MIRTFVTGFVERPEVIQTAIRYIALVSYVDTSRGFQWEDQVPFVANDTDTPAQVQTAMVAAVKAGGEAHGLTMVGTTAFIPTYGKITF